jgi:serine/threonine protein phosphatase PrpC
MKSASRLMFVYMIFGSMLTNNWGLFSQFPTIDTGFLNPHYKEKGIFKKVTEDALSTSWNGIFVADGVGGNSFPSLGIAQALVTEVNLELARRTQEITSKSDFEDIISTKTDKVIKRYERRVKDIMQEKKSETKKFSENFAKDNFRASTTFIAAHITKVLDDKPTLSIFQKGDSSVIVLRKIQVKPLSKSYYFRPIYVSKPMEYAFNTPYSYAAFADDNKSHFTKHIAIEEGDLVIVCSDGVTDNLSVTLIAYLVNYGIKLLLKGTITAEEYKILITNIIKKWVDFVKAGANPIEEKATVLVNEHIKKQTSPPSVLEVISQFFTEKFSFCNECLKDEETDFEEDYDSYTEKNPQEGEVKRLSELSFQDKRVERLSSSPQEEILEDDKLFYLFQCTAEDVAGHDFTLTKKESWISDCVKYYLRKTFQFDYQDLANLQKKFDSR